VRRVGDPPLAVGHEQIDQDLEGLWRGARPLEPEADKIHADQRGPGPRRVVQGGDPFVSDGHAEFIDAVLGPPQPGGARKERGMRAGVADGEVLRAQGATGRRAPPEGHRQLDLTDGPIRILGEEHPGCARGTQGVTHVSSIWRLSRVSLVDPRHALTFDQIDLSDIAFWTRPWEEREGAFQLLRREHPLAFFEEPAVPGKLAHLLPRGPGYRAVTRHAHITEVSRHPEIYRSGQGATSILDMPEEMLEFFGSMISMDNPRHAR
jgi:hypothetical protein